MKPTYYQSADFGFNRNHISSLALRVVEGLQDAGYDGYLVGGCVRDLLMGKVPKDFDVTTDAHPEEVKKLFPRARIIGRRFRIVHVRSRQEVIEVATYRANPNAEKKKNWFGFGRKAVGQGGRILDDNVWGSIEDDAVRRDFTANALYYDPNAEQVIDFLGGVEDIEAHRLKMMGKPADRFAEDPVRMLRVIRFRAKLDLQPDARLISVMERQRELLRGVPPARLFDEVLKMFHHAHGVRSWQELEQFGMLPLLFEQTADVLDEEDGDRWRQLILQALENTDRRISQDKPVIPAFLYTVLLWHPFNQRYQALSRDTRNYAQALHQAADEVFAVQSLQVSIPRRVSGPATEIWALQGALERRRPRTIQPTLQNRRFRAAYDFLVLRARIGDADQGLADWWTQIQDCGPEEQNRMIQALAKGGAGDDHPPGRRKSRRRSRRRGASASRSATNRQQSSSGSEN